MIVDLTLGLLVIGLAVSQGLLWRRLQALKTLVLLESVLGPAAAPLPAWAPTEQPDGLACETSRQPFVADHLWCNTHGTYHPATLDASKPHPAE
jgi:hypothetical protein